jgi:hypothetical protein
MSRSGESGMENRESAQPRVQILVPFQFPIPDSRFPAFQS